MKGPVKNALEWAVFGLSLALLLGVTGYIVAQSFSPAGEAVISVELGEPAASGGSLALPVTIINAGATAVEDVVVEVTVRLVGAPPERAELTVPLLARGAAEEARVLVPDAGEVAGVEGRVLGYRLP